ncbi:MAG: hypothetical protein ISS15_19390 [Alphaproteobacteria bacterium]|nr:hypothetical protein [Alphaproteobacteria bacterium]MBL7099827.1 hypothetical protein [Alphaproteobacteria bacterium]
MNKLPVGQVIREAYVFTFTEIGTVIGLTWIPTVINTVASYFMFRAYVVTLEGLGTGATTPADSQAILPLPLAILCLFMVGMVGVALTRQVLGIRKGPAFAHFALGGEEFRAFAGFVGVYLMTLLFVLLLMVVVGSVAVMMGGAAGSAAGGIAGLAGIVGVFLMIYAVVRLGYLLVPSVVVDGQFGLTRSWQLTKGNFWRIVAILLATLMPLALISDVASALVIGSLPTAADATQPTDLAGVARIWADQLHETMPHLPALMGVSLVLAPLGYSLLFTPAALAYRILAGKAIIQAHDG